MMMRIFLLSLTLLSSHVLANETVIVYGYGIKDSSYVDSSKELRGKNHGGRQAFLTELVRELMIKLNSAPDIRPVEKAEPSTQLTPKSMQAVLGVDRSASTESGYKWVGPLLSDSALFLGRKGIPTSIRSVDDARKVDTICARRGTPQATALKNMGFDNIQLAASYEVCWDSVAAGRAELTVISEALFPAVKKSVGEVADKVTKTGVKLYDDEVYLAFSKATPSALLDQWKQALEGIKASRQYNSLIHHYYCRQDCF